MQDKLIFLSGDASTGKTTTLKFLIAMLLNVGATVDYCRRTQVPTEQSILNEIDFEERHHLPAKDISIVLILKGIRIGIRTEGDTIGSVWNAVVFFEKQKCDIGVAACHPEHLDRSESCLAHPWKKPIKFDKQKATSADLHKQENQAMAKVLFDEIMKGIN